MRALLTRAWDNPGGDRHPPGKLVTVSDQVGAALLESGAARSPGGNINPRGEYDPARQVYNWHPGNTRQWRRAIARVLSGGTAARINCYGPSTVAGYTVLNGQGTRSEFHAWPSYLRRLLAQRYGESGTGVIYFQEDDPRVQLLNTGWERQPYGPFGQSCWRANGNPYQWLRLNDVRCTGFRVTFLAGPGAGKLAANSDNGTPLVVDCSAPAWQVKTAALPAGALGCHTLTVGPQGADTGPVFVIGVEGYVGPTSSWTDSGVRVTSVSRGSTVVANLVHGDDTFGTSLGAAVDANASDLAIVAYVENSPSYQDVAGMKADLRVLLDRIRASGSDLLLMTSIDWQGSAESLGMLAPQPLYDNAVCQLADEYDAAVFDVAARWGTWEQAGGYYGDRIHQSPAGNADIAMGLAHALSVGVGGY